jgi:DNA polymerase-3 subunit delta'
MAFRHFPQQTQGVELLQRSLARGRLGHAYLFAGDQLEELETLARTLAKTLNCRKPVKTGGVATDCCDECPACQKIDHGTHADVFWVRPESRMRQIKIEQIARRDESPARVVNEFVNLKPTEAEYKIGVLVAADRLTPQAANAFLKTLEEPPARSVLILLSTEPQRLLETIQSRCLRLSFFGDHTRRPDPAQLKWLMQFAAMAAGGQKSLLSRYRLLDVLLQKLGEIRSQVEEALTAGSPLQRYDEVEKDLREKWEAELAAAIEAEYRHRRAETLLLVQWWLRDVWLSTLGSSQSGNAAEGRNPAVIGNLLKFPELSGTRTIAGRIIPPQALENLQALEQTQRLLHTNVQEALALEVGLLKLHF